MTDTRGDLRELAGIMQDLENSINLEKFVIGDINYWPIIRFQINFFRKYESFMIGKNRSAGKNLTCDQLKQELAGTTIRFRSERLISQAKLQLSTSLKSLRNRFDRRRFAAYPEQAKLMFLCLEKEHHHSIGGKLFAPLIDSIILQCRDSYSTTKLTLLPASDPDRWFVPAVPVNSVPSYIKSYSKSDALSVLDNCREIEELLNNCYPRYRIHPRMIIETISKIDNQARIFERFLKAIKPRCLFVTSYTGRSFAILAAKRLGIKTIDVQHGGMHPFNIACTHWSNVPKSGYNLLPDCFWCWTDEARDYINKTITYKNSVPSSAHMALTGGNPSYPIWFGDPSLSQHIKLQEHERGLEKLSELHASKPVVLFALQYGADELIEDFIVGAYKQTRNQWLWLFRLHPMAKHREQELYDVLGEDYLQELVRIATNTPLPLLSANCDLLISKSSTSVREVIGFGVKPIICSARGARIHADLVDRNQALTAFDTDTLVNILRTYRATAPVSHPRDRLKQYRHCFEEAMNEITLDFEGIPRLD